MNLTWVGYLNRPGPEWTHFNIDSGLELTFFNYTAVQQNPNAQLWVTTLDDPITSAMLTICLASFFVFQGLAKTMDRARVSRQSGGWRGRAAAGRCQGWSAYPCPSCWVVESMQWKVKGCSILDLQQLCLAKTKVVSKKKWAIILQLS